jgi:hypothetical protein
MKPPIRRGGSGTKKIRVAKIHPQPLSQLLVYFREAETAEYKLNVFQWGVGKKILAHLPLQRPKAAH